jgi:hypothetical protein
LAETIGGYVDFQILLAGSVGALTVFCLGIGKELWLHHRERIGLLRLIYMEVRRNRPILYRLSQLTPTDFKQHIEVRLPEVDTWKDARTKLSQLLRQKLFEELARYYYEVEKLRDLFDENTSSIERQNKAPKIVQRLRTERGPAVVKLVEPYVLEGNRLKRSLAEAAEKGPGSKSQGPLPEDTTRA